MPTNDAVQAAEAKAAAERAAGDGRRADRESLGRMVRAEWIAWAREQPTPKASWLVPWEQLSEPDREVDRRIGERLAAAGAERAAGDASPERVCIGSGHPPAPDYGTTMARCGVCGVLVWDEIAPTHVDARTARAAHYSDALTWIERNEPGGIAIVARALAAEQVHGYVAGRDGPSHAVGCAGHADGEACSIEDKRPGRYQPADATTPAAPDPSANFAQVEPDDLGALLKEARQCVLYEAERIGSLRHANLVTRIDAALEGK